MRIERVDLEGFQNLTGSFRMPDSGVGVWASGNGSGKSRLNRAVVAALYGDADEPGGWIMIQFVLDDGTSYSLARDLVRERVEITDTSGTNVTARFASDGLEAGERIFGLNRDEFAAAACVDGEHLSATVGNLSLLSALGERPAGAEMTSLDQPPAASPVQEAAAAPVEDLDIQIFRTAAEEMTFLGEVIEGESSGVELDFEIETTEPHQPAFPSPAADPGEPGITPLERLQRLRAALATLEIRHAAKKKDLIAHSERLHEMQTEAGRLSSLAEAEPRDVAELRRILQRLSELDDVNHEIVRAEAELRQRMESDGIAVRNLQRENTLFAKIDDEDLAFLEEFRQAETVRRGNQALTRSEVRLDEKRLVQIAAAQERAARLAMIPLGVAIVAILCSVVLPFVAPTFPTWVPLGAGFVAGLTGGAMLWRARRIRSDERDGIVEGQERKKAQLEELKREERETTFRVEGVADKCGAGTAASLLDHYEHWAAHTGERADLQRIQDRAHDLEQERISLRERLERFAAAQSGGEPTDSALVDPDQLHQDYVRFFELRDVILEAEAISADIEDELIALETDRAELKQEIEDVLESDGVDPEPSPASSDAESPEASAAAGIREHEPARAIEMEWSPIISARTEAILRRFLPQVRDIEVDGLLAPSLRLGRETLRFDQIRREFSAAALDQVYLALRLAIVETLGSSGERLPVFLDDPLTRADDVRHDRALEFLVEDASSRGQVVLLTAHEVRTKWFLHQHPQHRDGLTPITDVAPVSEPARPVAAAPTTPDVITADQHVIAPPEEDAPASAEERFAPPPPLPPRSSSAPL